jgi:hypothetical protein
VDDLCADRELLAALRAAVADDRATLEAAGPPPRLSITDAARLGDDLDLAPDQVAALVSGSGE